ncbi:MAG: 4-(cytidine 5'-diphospho)-2-C-methyl-D-erythritol kinase [Ruminiclostridium sp.]|nr:4-(cytidine 5'-diphospho)-2-C-methyl-D-erythritol kinase [Ruminiclostridium sp.]
MTIRLKAYAKLNLLLDITGIMPNGYHYLDNVTQSVDIGDIITVTAEKSNRFICNITCDNKDIPTDERNIVYKAAKKFSDRASFDISCDIDIIKQVPLMGGMGGSSVDGAGTLFALNNLFGNPLSEGRILSLGEEIGADVPLCYMGGTIFSYSNQETSSMEFIKTNTNVAFLCIQPDFFCNTATAYRMYDSSPIPPFDKTLQYLDNLRNEGILSASADTYNVFTLLHNDSRIDEIKAELIKVGAIASEMTGSGSVVFGIFEDIKKAEKAKTEISSKYSNIFTCTPVDKGIITI